MSWSKLLFLLKRLNLFYFFWADVKAKRLLFVFFFREKKDLLQEPLFQLRLHYLRGYIPSGDSNCLYRLMRGCPKTVTQYMHDVTVPWVKLPGHFALVSSVISLICLWVKEQLNTWWMKAKNFGLISLLTFGSSCSMTKPAEPPLREQYRYACKRSLNTQTRWTLWRSAFMRRTKYLVCLWCAKFMLFGSILKNMLRLRD